MFVKEKTISFVVCAVLLAGCQPQMGPPPAQVEIRGPLVWPQPPLRPRIRFLKTVARPTDLGIKSSFLERLGEIIVGREEDWFVRPSGVAVGGDVIYVADPGAQALWILDSRKGEFRKIQDARGQRLISPVSVTVDSKNRIYLADSYLAKIFVYDIEGKPIATIEQPGLSRPAGLFYDARHDRLYVADSAAHQIWIFSGEGKSVGVIGQRGTDHGEFNFPTHISVGRDGALYATDTLNFRVQIFDTNGKFAGQFGRHGDSSGDFASPKGVALDSEGHTYVVDALFDAVQIFDRQGRYLLTFGERGIGPGQFWLPSGVFIDDHDRIYVADSYNQRIQIFEYLAGG